MKYLLFTGVLLAISDVLPAQVGASAKILPFQEAAIRKIQPERTVYYYSPLPETGAIRRTKNMNKRRVQNIFPNNNNFIVLTRTERKIIRKGIHNWLTVPLADSLIKNAHPVLRDSLCLFAIRLNYIFRHPLYSREWKRVRPRQFYPFFLTPPVYLRDKNVALVYSGWFDGGGGQEELCFYKRLPDGEWEKWISVAAGAW